LDADALLKAREAAAAMLGASVEVEPVRTAGRNSRVFRVRAPGGAFALKHYPASDDDARDRLGTEVGALRLMERHGITDVPRVEHVDRGRGHVLLSWIDGAVVNDVTDADIDAGAAFLSAVHGLRRLAGASGQPPASEACLSGAEIERQIVARLARLRGEAGDEPELVEFAVEDFGPVLRESCAEARDALAASRLDFAAELPHQWRSLVPSDFGYHNSLRRPDGSLAFLDFEYFGWDDPVKLTADILLHPGRPLALPQRRRLRAAAVRVYAGDPTFETRIAACLPLFGLRWVLILLNEFIPAVWQRRVRAGTMDSWRDAKARQLARARALLRALPQQVKA
jgi:hypothetical protein